MNKTKATLSVKDAPKINELITAAKELSFLNQCELEGLRSGQPSPEQWRNAFEKLDEILEEL